MTISSGVMVRRKWRDCRLEVLKLPSSKAYESIDILTVVTTYIEEHRRCFVLGGYFMSAVLAAPRYSRIGLVSVFTLPYVHGV